MYLGNTKLRQVCKGSNPIYNIYQGSNKTFSWNKNYGEGTNVSHDIDDATSFWTKKGYDFWNLTTLGTTIYNNNMFDYNKLGKLVNLNFVVRATTFQMWAPVGPGQFQIGLVCKYLSDWSQLTYEDFTVGFIVESGNYYEVVNGVKSVSSFNGFGEQLYLEVYGGYAHTRRGVSLTGNYESRVQLTNPNTNFVYGGFLCVLGINAAYDICGANHFQYWR